MLLPGIFSYFTAEPSSSNYRTSPDRHRHVSPTFLASVVPAPLAKVMLTSASSYEPAWTPSGILKATTRLLDSAIAWDLGQHVQDGYTFLMQ